MALRALVQLVLILALSSPNPNPNPRRRLSRRLSRRMMTVRTRDTRTRYCYVVHTGPLFLHSLLITPKVVAAAGESSCGGHTGALRRSPMRELASFTTDGGTKVQLRVFGVGGRG